MKLSQTEIEARLAEVRRSYIASLQAKRDSIELQWSTLLAQWDSDTFQSLYLIVHSLAGSAETFGLTTITQDARKVVEQLKRHDRQYPLDAQCLPTLTADLQQLIHSMTAVLEKLDQA
jgi:HPt (histidine-containing phosphotransfer) domain-containing protein